MNNDLAKYTIDELKNLKSDIDEELLRREKEEASKYIKEIIKLLEKLREIYPTKEFLLDGYYDYQNFIYIFEDELKN